MDFYMLNNFNNDDNNPKREIDKKKLIRIISIACIVLLIITIIILYMNNLSFRNFFDTYIFRKNVYENNLDTILLNEDDNNHVYAVDKNIVVLSASKLNIYNSSGKKEHSLDMEISNPIFACNNKYLAVAEENGQELYLICDNNILWHNNTEGNIVSVSINKNGYVSVILDNTSYKTIIKVYNPSGGKELTFSLASKYAINTTISNDNKYLAVAEVDFAGTVIQSSVEIISMESQTSEYNYMADSNKILVNIKYQDKNKLVCMYDDSIHIIENNNDSEFMQYNYKDSLFMDINFNSHIAQVEKTSSGLFTSNSQIKFTNVSNNGTNLYEINGIPKSIYSYKDVTAINLGNEAVFVKTSGWLSKRYKSSQEIRDIVLTNNIAGIVYKNKIEIVKL